MPALYPHEVRKIAQGAGAASGFAGFFFPSLRARGLGEEKPVPPYSAIIYKEDDEVRAEDWKSRKIASGEAGVNDASVIQSAIDSVANAGGGKVFIRAGTYIIPEVPDGGNAIEIKPNVEVIGEDRNTLLKLSENISVSSHSYAIILTDNSALIDLSVDGNRAALEGLLLDGVSMRGNYCKIVRVYIKDCPRYNVRAFNVSSILIANCIAEHACLSNFMLDSISHSIIAHCIAYLAGRNGISCDTLRGCDVIGNTCYENSFSGIRCGDGIMNTAIVGNSCLKNAAAGIRTHQEAIGLVIANNICRENDFGINLENGKYNIVSNNLCQRNGRGIRLAYSSHNFIIGNYCLENYLENDPSGENILLAKDNHYNIIKNNVCRIGEGERSSQYGIRITGWSPQNTNNIIIDNDVANGGASANILDEGDNTLIKRNLGYTTENSGTATFSGDGTTTQFSIAHGLVSEPSKVQVTPMTEDAAGDFYVTKDATNIYVNYLSAPPSGSNNVKLSWYAEV